MNSEDLGTSRLRAIIIEHLAQRKWGLMLAAFSLLAVIAMELLAPWPLKIIVDHVLLSKPLTPGLSVLAPLFGSSPLFTISLVAGSIFVMVVIGGVFSYLQIFITTKVGHELTYRLRGELFSRLQQFSLAFHTQSRIGDLLIKLSSDTAALKDLFADWTLMIASHVLLLCGMVIIMFMLNWQLTLVVLASLPILFVVLTRLNRRITLSARAQRNQEGTMAARVTEVLSSINLVQAFGREGYEEDRFDAASTRSLAEGIRTARATAAVNKSIGLVSALCTSATVLFGAWFALKGSMSPGELLIFVAYVRGLYKPIRDLGKLSAKFSRALVSAGRISDILSLEPEITDTPDAIVASELKGEIEFDNVSFGYRDTDQVLNGVSFHIRPGQRVALVGASGAGKSTIVKLILRLYEAGGGEVRLDGINVKSYQRESLRREIGIVLQDTVLFGASVRENISYGKPDATQKEIEEAACEAHAHDFISALPEGYETILGERGATLSGGQRQRICLARAIVKRPSILILDEPTSAVDPESAHLISEAIKRIQQGKTTLVISHQFSSLYEFDQVLVMKDGTIVECGPHDDLLHAKGHFFELRRGGRA